MKGILEQFLGPNKATTTEEQLTVHCGEIFQLWQHLVKRYDIRELTDIFQNFAKDTEFKAILSLGLNVLDEEIKELEDEMKRLGIPLPARPPKSINTSSNTEVLRDELMFRIVYTGIQSFLSEQIQSILAMQNKKLRNIFLKMERKEIDMYNKMSVYGKLKGWIYIPPEYGPK